MGFSKSFHNFKETGFFLLKDASVTFSELLHLYDYIKDNRQTLETLSCRFILNRIELVSDVGFFSDQLSKPSVLEIIRDNQLGGRHQEIYDIRLVPFERQQALLTGALLGILTLTIRWKAIKLEDIKFVDSNGLNDERLNHKFSSVLLQRLAKSSVPEVLRLKDIPVDYRLLAKMIKNNSSLRTLELNSTTPLDDKSLGLLTTALYSHPGAKKLELFGTMSQAHYQHLKLLLNNNYRITEIVLPQPQEQDLNKLHNQLLSRLEQDSEERFIREKLSKEDVYHLLRNSIVNKEPETLDVLLKPPSFLLRIGSADERKIEMQRIKRFLPDVYAGHLELMENSWRESSLDFSVTLPGYRRSIGELLIEEAFKTNNEQIIKLVLDYGLPSLKINPELNKFLKRKLFEYKRNYAWKDLIIKYFNQDLSTHSPWINKLTPYPKILSKLNAFHKHLVRHLVDLVKLNHQWYITKLLSPSFANYTKKQIEWGNQFYDFIEGIQRAEQIENTENSNLGEQRCKSFSELCDQIKKIIDRTDKTKLGYWERTSFHRESFLICDELVTLLNPYCLNKKINELILRLESSERERSIERQRHEQEKEELSSKIIQLEENASQAKEEVREEMQGMKSKIKEMGTQMQNMMSQMQGMQNRENGLVVNEEPQIEKRRNGLLINDEEPQASTSRAHCFNP